MFTPVFGEEMRLVDPEEVRKHPERLPEDYIFDPLAIDECQTFQARNAPLPPSVKKKSWVSKVNRHWAWKLLPPALVLVMWYSFGYLLYTRAIDRATSVQLTGVVICLLLAHYICLRKNR